ncbi:MAG TPA: DUF1634 domain-containing protein [Crinalium sp.]|jgi:uncharacterized membrane protein
MPPLEPEVQSVSIAAQRPLAQRSLEVAVDLSVECHDQPGTVDERSPDYQLGVWLSRLLKYGVIIASVTVLVGGVLYLMRHGMEPVDYHRFRGEPDMFRSPQGVWDAVLSGHRRGIIQLGLLILIATPVVRVIMSLLFFIRQRDLVYVVITSLVFSGLLYSLVGAYL